MLQIIHPSLSISKKMNKPNYYIGNEHLNGPGDQSNVPLDADTVVRNRIAECTTQYIHLYLVFDTWDGYLLHRKDVTRVKKRVEVRWSRFQVLINNSI